ncbi:retrotransposon protein, putative, ty3-gypsy subclass [Tanacetum coccineum]
MESSTSFQPNQPYSPINTNLDMNFEELIFSQDYNYSQDYSICHGSGHGSAYGSAPVQDDEDDSPVEETALCQAWCDVSENNIDGNSMKSKGFWDAVLRVRPRIDAFCAIINNVEENHESCTNDLDVYHKACVEYKMMYKQDFTLEHCYNILKDHLGWKDVEMPAFYNTQGRKKSKTSETTSGSASGGLNLNEEADEAMEDTQEFRPMGRDRAKAKKKAAVSSRGGSSSFFDLVADKFFNIKQKKWRKKDE